MFKKKGDGGWSPRVNKQKAVPETSEKPKPDVEAMKSFFAQSEQSNSNSEPSPTQTKPQKVSQPTSSGNVKSKKSKGQLEKDPGFKKYLMMKKMGRPLAGIRQKIIDDGIYAQGDIDLFATSEELKEAGPHHNVGGGAKRAAAKGPSLAEQLQANQLQKRIEVK